MKPVNSPEGVSQISHMVRRVYVSYANLPLFLFFERKLPFPVHHDTASRQHVESRDIKAGHGEQHRFDQFDHQNSQYDDRDDPAAADQAVPLSQYNEETPDDE